MRRHLSELEMKTMLINKVFQYAYQAHIEVLTERGLEFDMDKVVNKMVNLLTSDKEFASTFSVNLMSGRRTVNDNTSIDYKWILLLTEENTYLVDICDFISNRPFISAYLNKDMKLIREMIERNRSIAANPLIIDRTHEEFKLYR